MKINKIPTSLLCILNIEKKSQRSDHKNVKGGSETEENNILSFASHLDDTCVNYILRIDLQTLKLLAPSQT